MTPSPTLAVLEIGGIPAHPLVVHSIVTLVPLLAVAAVALMLLRADLRRRWALPLAAVSLALLALTQVGLFTGEQLADATGEEDDRIIEEHEEQAETLRVALAAMTGLLAATGWAARRDVPAAPRPAPAGNAASPEAPAAAGVAADRRSLLSGGLRLATGAAALGVIGATVATGHSGATSVWEDAAAEIRAGGGDSDDD